jgi:hypothetical protein
MEQTKENDGHMELPSRHVDHHGERGLSLYSEPSEKRPRQYAWGTSITLCKHVPYIVRQIEGSVPSTVKKSWGDFLKGRLSRDWIGCMDHHFRENCSKLTGQ